MRPADQFVRLWEDARLRMPAGWRRAILALVASVALGALIGASGSLIGASLSGGTLKTTPSAAALDSTPTSAAAIPESRCQEEVWPYLSKDCLHQPDRNAAKPPAGARVISLDRDAPSTVFIYPEKPKSAGAKPKRPAASREAKTEKRGQPKAERRAAPQRNATPADDPYRAYGYSRRERSRR